MLQWSFYLQDTHLSEEGMPIKPATYVRGKTQRHQDLEGLLSCFIVARIFLRKANLSFCLRILHHARHLDRFRYSMYESQIGEFTSFFEAILTTSRFLLIALRNYAPLI